MLNEEIRSKCTLSLKYTHNIFIMQSNPNISRESLDDIPPLLLLRMYPQPITHTYAAYFN